MSGLRVIVFSCSDLGNEVVNRLRSLDGIGAVAVMYAPHRLAVKKVSAVDVLKRKWKLEGPVATLRALAGRVLPFLREASIAEQPEVPLDDDIRRFEVGDFHDASAIDQIRSFAADLGVVAGTYILKESVFGLPSLGSINLHSGRAPEYRGAAPAFWELYNGETEVGITIHRVTDQLDSGHILAQEVFPLDRAPTEDPMSYVTRYREDVLRPNGVRMLSDVAAAIANDTHTDTPQDPTNAKTYRRPDYRAIKELRRRVSVRRKGLAQMKQRLKHWLGFFLAKTSLYRRLLGNRAIVVLFHRVDSRLPGDHISCTEEEFAEWCPFFKQHFDVVSLGQLQDDLREKKSVDNKLVITFDDGYLDNWKNAAPELVRHQLPACFFIATEMIASDRVPWWDEELPIKPEWMSWDQVRDLHAQGFEIGAHTMNHVDMGDVEVDESIREVTGSQSRLQDELQAEVPHFSYPYGRRDNITPANLQTVVEAGFETCSSAYGGFVDPETDRLNLQRMPISPWFISPYHFLLEMVMRTRSADFATTTRPYVEVAEQTV